MKKYQMLDLYCGEGGASKGYHDAGFDVIGVDMSRQARKRYPYTFYLENALHVLKYHAAQFDFIHASPPCQSFSKTYSMHGNIYKSLINETRELLIETGKPYIIENVVGAHLINPIMLCGTMFGINTTRHRIFESNIDIIVDLKCNHVKEICPLGAKPNRETQYITIAGNFSDVEFARQTMGMKWASIKGLAQAIPPVYTEYLGKQVVKHLETVNQNVNFTL